MKTTRLEDLALGDFFALEPVEAPTAERVYVRMAYDMGREEYLCRNWANINRCIYLKGETEVSPIIK